MKRKLLIAAGAFLVLGLIGHALADNRVAAYAVHKPKPPTVFTTPYVPHSHPVLCRYIGHAALVRVLKVHPNWTTAEATQAAHRCVEQLPQLVHRGPR